MSVYSFENWSHCVYGTSRLIPLEYPTRSVAETAITLLCVNVGGVTVPQSAL